MRQTARSLVCEKFQGRLQFNSLCVLKGKLSSFSTDDQHGQIEVSEVLLSRPISKKVEKKTIGETESRPKEETNQWMSYGKSSGDSGVATVPLSLRLIEFSTRNLYGLYSSGSCIQESKDCRGTQDKNTCHGSCLYPCYLRAGIFLTAWLSIDSEVVAEEEGKMREERASCAPQLKENKNSLYSSERRAEVCLPPHAERVEVIGTASPPSSFPSSFASSAPLPRICSKPLPLSQFHAFPHSSRSASSLSSMDFSYDVIRLDENEFSLWREGYARCRAKMRKFVQERKAVKEEDRKAFESHCRSVESEVNYAKKVAKSSGFDGGWGGVGQCMDVCRGGEKR